MKISETDRQLIPFLKKLINLLETNEITELQLECIGEFYMTYILLEREGRTKGGNEGGEEGGCEGGCEGGEEGGCEGDEGWCEGGEDEIDSKEMIKFLTLGWYFYKVLKKRN